MDDLFIISGEPSSSNYIEGILYALRNRGFNGNVHAVCSKRLASKGVDVVFDPNEFATVGMFEAVVNFSSYARLFRITLSKIRTIRPKVVLLMDLPDFNLKIARQLTSLGIPSVYFIPPQVWAWRRSRVELLRRYIDKLFVTFRFEEEFYKKHSLKCEFVGHPLVKIISEYKPEDLRKMCNIGKGEFLISLFPASRMSQFKRFMPMLCRSVKLISEGLSSRGYKCRFALGLSENVLCHKYKKYLNGSQIIEVSGKGYDLMASSDLVISTCGTTTLEIALFERPMVAFYRINPLLAKLLRALMKFSVGYYSLPNLLAGKEIIPELIQEKATVQNIANNVVSIIVENRMEDIRKQLVAIKASLGGVDTFGKIADELLEYL
ncbi:MAG: lipid-A-disaccharide synthase [Planctomycetes bacterium]|nr:lipid-A-disaccharide synthase [Planctomycetota bacterium]